ncbi:MAG: 2-hydroxyacyl-CoA dehydratase family protein [Planctomycetota bacterium]|jgi:benzoyl-CoA reductase/2-hydroxyglutaryl-CoA dehydratase subunit BcrC/BadD/HgdB
MPSLPKQAVGITTTVPIEVLYAAGRCPVDLNNLFISHATPHHLIQVAERNGFPRTCCAWLKGLYGTIHEYGVETIVGVTVGDCSETHVLLEILESEGRTIIPFAYPNHPDPKACKDSIEELCAHLDTSVEKAETFKERLDAARSPCHDVDTLYGNGQGEGGAALFSLLLNCSDFQGDPTAHRLTAEAMRDRLQNRPALPESVRRIGLLGVPPIYNDLIEVVEARNARITFFEVPRQFALPTTGVPLAESYSAYTYPYGAGPRIDDIRTAVHKRRLDGLIHYVQSFCHRCLHDRLLREGLEIPILTLEGDRPGPVDGAVLTRIEAFLEML